jgi:hypothetical protein
MTSPQGFDLYADYAAIAGAISGAGDINKDGYDDIIIGFWNANNNAGITYVVYGDQGYFSDIDLTKLTSEQGFWVQEASSNSYSGQTVSGIGDINGDGCDDIAIGAPETTIVTYINNIKYTYTKAGACYVIFGKAEPFTNINLAVDTTYFGFYNTSEGIQISGATSYGYVCSSVSSAGDFNKDGYDDIIIGAYGENSNTGTSYIIFGKKSRFNNIDLANLGEQGIRIYGAKSGDKSGWSVSGAGDINGDGFDDVIIGAPNADSNFGKTYVIFGSSSPTLTPTATPSFKPSSTPSQSPTATITSVPSVIPTIEPSEQPTIHPTTPTVFPTLIPTNAPTNLPTTHFPTTKPTSPTIEPTYTPTAPTGMPSCLPTSQPTIIDAFVNSNDKSVNVAAAVGGSIGGLFITGILAFLGYTYGSKLLFSNTDNNPTIDPSLSQDNNHQKTSSAPSNEIPETTYHNPIPIAIPIQDNVPIADVCLTSQDIEHGSNPNINSGLVYSQQSYITKAVFRTHYNNPLLNHPQSSEIFKYAYKIGGTKVVNTLISYQGYVTEDVEEVKNIIKELFAETSSAIEDKAIADSLESDSIKLYNLQSCTSNSLITAFLDIQSIIESYPLIKYLSTNIIYPLVESYIPESVKNITLPEISNAMLVTAHMSLGHLYAWQQPQASVPFYIVESVAKSGSFAARLGVTEYINDYRDELEHNEKTITITESLKHCASTLLTYTVPDLLICVAAKTAMQSYDCSDLNLGTKLSFAGSECYWSYKASQEPIEPTTADVVMPYIADLAAGVAAYVNGCGLVGVTASVVSADWMSRMMIDALQTEIKSNIMEWF